MSANISIPRQTSDTSAGESVQADLCGFATSMLEKCGGVVEWDRPAETGVAMLPEKVARMLGVDETTPLATRQEPGAVCISLASDFLDHAQVVLDSFVAHVGAFSIPDHYLTRGDLQEAIDRSFTWHNARVRVRGSEPKTVDYHSWWFFGSLKSEDIWESRVNVTINAESHAPVDLPDFLSLPDLEPNLEPPSATPENTFESAVKLSRSRLLNEAAGFVARMDSRLERDRKRLRDYYGALSREAGSSKRKSATPPSQTEIDARKNAVDLELERKLIELRERYQIDASVEPIALVGLSLNVLAIELWVQRKRAERIIHLYWNPLTKRLEPLQCTHCGEGTYSVAFTDEEVAPLCAHCHASKASASRPASKVGSVP